MICHAYRTCRSSGYEKPRRIQWLLHGMTIAVLSRRYWAVCGAAILVPVFIDRLKNSECTAGGELLVAVAVLQLHIHAWTNMPLCKSLSSVFPLVIFHYVMFVYHSSVSYAWTNMPLYIFLSSVSALVFFHFDACMSVVMKAISFCLSPPDTVQFLIYSHMKLVSLFFRCLFPGPLKASFSSDMVLMWTTVS